MNMETGSVSSLQTSMANSSARSTPIPNYKPLTPSSSILALSNMPDDDMRRRSPDDLVQIVRRMESEYRGMISEHGAIMKDVNKKIQILLLEIRGLKDINQNLQDDNQELRDLCCFLDDDRQRGRKLAREWQRFGRYTASVMRSEVSAYQEKLKQLEQKQEELIADNLELKELCLFLDQERLRLGQTRDEGDGSSSSTVAGGDEPQSDVIELLPVSQLNQNGSNNGNVPVTNDYVHHLEEQIRYLEEEKRVISQELDNSKKGYKVSPGTKQGPQTQVGTQRLGPDGNQPRDGGKSPSPTKPEAVVHAMKVLEVHENLERPHTTVGEENLDDKEKAIVREMCNVVWRKLGNVSSEQQGSGSSTPQHPVYENVGSSSGRHTPNGPRSDPRNDPRNVPRSDPAYGHIPPMQQQYPHSHNPNQQPLRSNIDPRSYPDSRSSLDSRSYSDARSYADSRSHQDSRSNMDSGHVSQYSMDPGGMGGIYTAQPVTATQRSQSGQGQPSQGQQYNHQGHSGHKYTPGSQAQRPPPSSHQSSGQGPAPPNPHYSSQPPSYGYVRTSHSTPVTPTPMQRSHSPTSKPHSVSNPNMRQEPRSHSPGPNRAPQTRHDPQTQPQGQKHPHLYQNQPINRGDHSYENIPYGYNPPSSKSYDDQHMPSNSSGRNDHPPPPHIGSHYTHNDIPAPSPGYPSRSRPQSVSHDHRQGNQNTQYQNVQVRQPVPMKQSRRDPSPQGYNLRQGSNQQPPSQPQGPHRNMPSSDSYSQQYPPVGTPQVTRRPAQPQYNRDMYSDPRNGQRHYQERGDVGTRHNTYH